jgi:hypothetical protein
MGRKGIPIGFERYVMTRAATVIELCQLTTSLDVWDHLAQPLFRPIAFPSKHDRQSLSSPQKVMLPTVVT